MAPQHQEHVKILFPLEQDEDGYPPVAAESLWATHVADHKYKLDNIPFYVPGVSAEDIVQAIADDEGVLRFKKVMTTGGHSTIRVVLFDQERVEAFRVSLQGLGCETEADHMPNLIAVDVPPGLEIRKVWSLLERGVRSDLLEYEDACIQHKS